MRIFIADHEKKVRSALRTLLLLQKGIEIVGEAATSEDLLAQVSATQPDLLLLHWRLAEEMPALLKKLKRLCPRLKAIALSVRQEACREALAAGADAFVCKMDPPDKLLAAIEVVRVIRSGDEGDRHGRQGQGCGSLVCPSAVEGKRAERATLASPGLRRGNSEPPHQSSM